MAAACPGGGAAARIALAALLAWAAFPAQGACPPPGRSPESLQALRSERFALPDDDARRTLAVALVDCLGDPDPALRDGIAYEALAQWLRAGALDTATVRVVRDRLYALLDGGEGDGFARPFAALVLSEVARTDRIAPWMTPGERAAMLGKAAAYLETVQDYRGFDDGEGWRHGVAHGADWLAQLALNPALERDGLDRILSAVATQAVPASGHAYVFGEPMRLANPVLQIARRGLHSQEEWETWFAALPPRIGDPGLAYADAAWLARRHDLLALLAGLYVEADRSADDAIRALKPAILAALESMP